MLLKIFTKLYLLCFVVIGCDSTSLYRNIEIIRDDTNNLNNSFTKKDSKKNIIIDGLWDIKLISLNYSELVAKKKIINKSDSAILSLIFNIIALFIYYMPFRNGFDFGENRLII